MRADEPAPARRRAHRSLAAPPHRPGRAARRAVRRHRRHAEGRPHPPCRAQRGERRGHRGGAGASSPWRRCRTVQPRRPARARRCSSTARRRASASFPGIRWPPARWRGPARSLAEIAGRLGATPGQVALAWVLRRSKVMLPIPGTGRVAHLRRKCRRRRRSRCPTRTSPPSTSRDVKPPRLRVREGMPAQPSAGEKIQLMSAFISPRVRLLHTP